MREVSADVIELCGLLQCLGYNIKSLDTRDGNTSMDRPKTVTITCQASGIQVMLESADMGCSCPGNANESNSGFWQVSGMTGGKQLNKETTSGLIGSLPRKTREEVANNLIKIISYIKDHNESELDKPMQANKSTSMLELNTPEKRNVELKLETPNRCKSLDTLALEGGSNIPGSWLLQRQLTHSADVMPKKTSMYQRQRTYTVSTTSGSIRTRNKTSSPIRKCPVSPDLLATLVQAETNCHDLKNLLNYIIHLLAEDEKNDSSMSSLALDVSRISLIKGPELSKPFTSSPNISSLGMANEDITKHLRRAETGSTTSLKSDNNSAKQSKLRKYTPGLLKFKKESKEPPKPDKKEIKSRLFSNFMKPKPGSHSVSPSTSRLNVDASPNLSGAKKKYSHIKSTIPRPSSKKE
ncbi:uncharacterized protein LOC126967478 [Leptidea sinapis]|uniref:uncharacterized protein LOC126967478 n=1 Tax=Leptidea sinapis TaxID=189913 RepID=UPI0021C3BD78|nr:uncharacterized protein LOC126967478 [Leptidea sinapis]